MRSPCVGGPGFDGIGGHAIGIAALAGTVGTLGFRRLYKRLRIERNPDKMQNYTLWHTSDRGRGLVL